LSSRDNDDVVVDVFVIVSTDWADGFYRSDDPTNSVKALKEGG